jgi:hypothetical protein
MNLYGETYDMANEEIDKHVAKMEHSITVLDHYRTLLDLTGQSMNYDAIGTVLEG